jgi:hypothetical protein
MRSRHFVLGLAGTMALAPLLLLAQQKPIAGCNAALSCRDSPLGYSALKEPGQGGLLFGAGVRFGPGFQFFFVTPRFAPSPTPALEGPMFHLRASLLSSPPTPTPAPEPATKASAPVTPAKN